MEAALGQSSENAERTLSAGGQVKHTPSTGPQAQTRAPRAHQEHRNGPNPAELPERRPTSGQVPRRRKTCCTSSESPAMGVQARPRRLQTQRQLVPPGLGDTKEGRTRPQSLEGGITPSSMETRSIWCHRGSEQVVSSSTGGGGEADRQASPRHPQAHGHRGPSFPPPALGQIWSAVLPR